MEAKVDNEIKQLLEQLLKAVNEVNKKVPREKTDEGEAMVRDTEALIKEAISSKPRRKWYEVSLEGLKQAATNIGEIAEPVLDIVRKLIPLLLAAG
jgi:HEPN domain-containing protein